MAARAVGARKLLAAALSKSIGAPVVTYDEYLQEKDSGVQFQELTNNEIFGLSHPNQPGHHSGRTAPRAQEEELETTEGYNWAGFHI